MHVASWHEAEHELSGANHNLVADFVLLSSYPLRYLWLDTAGSSSSSNDNKSATVTAKAEA
jgi:hypothetical protein